MAQKYKVGVCDWMILKRQKLGEFDLAKQIGSDGVEMDMGGLGQRELFDNKMRDDSEARHFKHVADSIGIEIGAIAMSGLYAQDLTKRDNYLALVEDCFDTMDKMGGAQVAFLPLGGCGNDWATDKVKRREVVKRLHAIGETAKKRGKRVGIDTPLDAKGNLKLLKEIKSEGIAIFYKWQTIVENGWDVVKDIKTLGAKNICAIHASNTDRVWLRNDSTLDVPKIKKALDEMGWSGWLFVERSRNTSMVKNVKMNYSANVFYLKEIFNSNPEPAVKLDSEGRDPQFKLNDIYAERDSIKKTDKKLAEAQCDSKLYRSHWGFLADLSMYLKPQEIDKVKDVMTFDVVRVTYEAQCDMIPTLMESEKQQIMAWLIEARELAIDAESSKKKHEVFGKYKGRINNYLSKRGYDLTKEREAWYERIKARGGQI